MGCEVPGPGSFGIAAEADDAVFHSASDVAAVVVADAEIVLGAAVAEIVHDLPVRCATSNRKCRTRRRTRRSACLMSQFESHSRT